MNFDYPRAREGGLDLPFMSIYVPASFPESGGARDVADELIEMVEGIVAAHPDKFDLVTSVAEARRIGEGKVGLAMGMENGAPIEGDLANLKRFHDRGIGYITLTHAKNNKICDSSYEEPAEREWNGLSPFGHEVVVEMNRLGIMIDISHVSDDAFADVMELSRAPALATHSSCRHFTPDWERNISDAMIESLAANGGVIHINFGSSFLTDEARRQSSDYWNERAEFKETNQIEDGDLRLEEFGKQYWETRDQIWADVTDVADHIDHVVGLVGVDHVGLGSDFDGVGDSLPTGLKDVSYYPNLIRVLLERGYSDEDIEKICSGNLMRVWTEVERVAREMQGR